MLSDLLRPEAILLDAEAADWTAAVTLAGDLLERTDVATADYTRAMIANVEDNGPYIVIAPGFAFAHARPSEAVARTGMSWVRLATPVTFGHAKHDPVMLVVALAATDAKAHSAAMAQLAGVIGDPTRRAALDEAGSAAEVLGILAGESLDADSTSSTGPSATSAEPGRTHRIMTVCGNGLGTSLFLKNTLEQVLDRWGWSRYVTVEATDTISARGKAGEADLILTSGEIARTLGEVGVPVRVVENFTSLPEVDAVLRDSYDV